MQDDSTVEQVWEYIRSKFSPETNLLNVQESFFRNDIDYATLVDLTENNLKEDLKIESLGIRKKIMRIISDLRMVRRISPVESLNSPSLSFQSGGDSRANSQVNRRLHYSSNIAFPDIFLPRLFDHDQTPAIRDSQRAVAICSYFVKRFLISVLKRIPLGGGIPFIELKGRIIETNGDKRQEKYKRVKLDMGNLTGWDQTLLSETMHHLPKSMIFEDKSGIGIVPIYEVLGKANLVLKFNTEYFDAESSADRSCIIRTRPLSPPRNTTGNLEDKYDKWSPIQKAFWEANRCQTVRIFCAGGKTLVQICDALGLTPHLSDRYSKILICGNSKASVNNVKKYFRRPAGRNRQGSDWRDFDDSNYDDCALRRMLNLDFEQYSQLMSSRVMFLEESAELLSPKFQGEPIIIASSQRITLQRQRKSLFDDSFGHIIIDEGDYGFAGPEDGSSKGEWKKMRDNNPAAFITYYSGTTQNAQGCEIPAPFVSITYKDLVLAGHVKTLCFYTLFGPKYRNVLPDGKLWNPREVPQLKTQQEREEADMCRRMILGTALYTSVCRKDPPNCVLAPYIRRALQVWLQIRRETGIPTQMLVFAPKICKRNESSVEAEAGPGRLRPRRRRSNLEAQAAAGGLAEPKVETKELVRKLVPVFEAILRELRVTEIRVGYAIGSDAECDESVERFRRCELDILINIRVLERSADFPMIGAILDLHSHSTPDGVGRAGPGAYAAAIQRFTRAARIIDPADPAIKAHVRYREFSEKLRKMMDDGVTQKMIIFELDLDPRDWILNRFCDEENTLLLTFAARSETVSQSLKEGGWVHVNDKDQPPQSEFRVVDIEEDEAGAPVMDLERLAPVEEGGDGLYENDDNSRSSTWTALNEAIRFSDEFTRASTSWSTFNDVLLEVLDSSSKPENSRLRTFIEMRDAARSEEYGAKKALEDCNTLLSYFCPTMLAGRANHQGTQEQKSAEQRESDALIFVKNCLECIFKQLKGALNTSEWVEGQSEEASKVDDIDLQRAAAESMKSLEEYVSAFEPALEYTRPILLDSFEDPKILVSNYQQLREHVEKVKCATIQVWCFKRTEPKNFYNTVLGNISSSGYVRWKVLPGQEQPASGQPHLVFEIQIHGKQMKTKLAYVDEGCIQVSDSTEEGDKSVETLSSAKTSLNSGSDLITDPCSSSSQGVDNLLETQDNVGADCPLEGMPVGSENMEIDSQADGEDASQTKEWQGACYDLRSMAFNTSQGSERMQGDDRQDDSDSQDIISDFRKRKAQVTQPKTISGITSGVATVHKICPETNEVETVEQDQSDAADEHEGSDMQDDDTSDSDYEDDMSESESDDSKSESTESDDSSHGNELESESSSGQLHYGERPSRRPKTKSSFTDAEKIEATSHDVEGHMKTIVADLEAPLRAVITERCYHDPRRNRPLNCPRISSGSLLRSCKPGNIVVVTNSFLREHVEDVFFKSYEPLVFHVCEVLENSDEDEVLVVRRLIPLSLKGQNCSKAAREGNLSTLLGNGTLQGPFIYWKKRVEEDQEIPLEKHIVIRIEHSVEANDRALLAILSSPAIVPGKLNSGDFFHESRANILVLCHEGKKKLQGILKNTNHQVDERILQTEPQLKSWDEIRKKFTVEGFFAWAKKYHLTGETEAMTRDEVWHHYLRADLSLDVQSSIRSEPSFADACKKLSDYVCNLDQALNHIAVKIKSIVIDGCDGEDGNGPLDGISHWSMLFCVDTGWNDFPEGMMDANQSSQYFKRFRNYCCRSLEYYVDADVLIFGGCDRPTPNAKEGKFAFTLKGCVLEVLSVSLRERCRLEVRREGKRVLYLPSEPTSIEKPIFDIAKSRGVEIATMVREVTKSIEQNWTKLFYEVHAKYKWDPENPIVQSALQRMITSDSHSNESSNHHTRISLNCLPVSQLQPLKSLSRDKLKSALQNLHAFAEKLIVVEREDNLYESLLIWEVEAKKHHRRRSSNKRHQPAVQGSVSSRAKSGAIAGRKRRRRDTDSDDSESVLGSVLPSRSSPDSESDSESTM